MGFDYSLFLQQLLSLGIITNQEDHEALLLDNDPANYKYRNVLVALFDKYRDIQDELEQTGSYLSDALEVVEFYRNIPKNYDLIQVSANPDADGIRYCPDEGRKAIAFMKDYRESRESFKDCCKEDLASYLKNYRGNYAK